MTDIEPPNTPTSGDGHLNLPKRIHGSELYYLEKIKTAFNTVSENFFWDMPITPTVRIVQITSNSKV